MSPDNIEAFNVSFRERAAGILRCVCLLLFLQVPRLNAQVQPLLLSDSCFDSLPHGAVHRCTAMLEWRSAESLDTLRVRLESAVLHDSARIALRHVGKTSLVFALDSQPPKGCCRHPFDGDSIGGAARLRFDASKQHKATVATLAVEGRARIYQGGPKYPLMLVLCYLAHYTAALGVSLPKDE
jgi:hypothetical protein